MSRYSMKLRHKWRRVGLLKLEYVQIHGPACHVSRDLGKSDEVRRILSAFVIRSELS